MVASCACAEKANVNAIAEKDNRCSALSGDRNQSTRRCLAQTIEMNPSPFAVLRWKVAVTWQPPFPASDGTKVAIHNGFPNPLVHLLDCHAALWFAQNAG